MIDGIDNWMDEKGFRTIDDFRGRSLPRVVEWKDLDLNYKIVAKIDRDKCIGCDLCYIACWDGAHQCIHRDGGAKPEQVEGASRRKIAWTPSPSVAREPGGRTPPERIPRVDEAECVGCNLCWLVCPVEDCITMQKVETGLGPETWEERSAK
jgi:dihydropyrimidine dehydrogenase (NAD+) subunit PreA